MQINAFSSKRMGQAIKTIFVLIVLIAIYLIINQKHESISVLKASLSQIITAKNLFLLIIVLLLTPINWAFEALKWQKLVAKIEKVSFKSAYKGVLVGLSMSTATPLMIGDYAGKILMLKSDKRTESIGAIMLGNGMQTFISLIFGFLSYIFFIQKVDLQLIMIHFCIVIILFLIIILGIYLALHLNKISQFIEKFKFLKSIKIYIQVLENYTFADLQAIFFIALARYLVFSFQFLLIFYIFGINLSFSILFAGIGMIFFAKTIASTLNFICDLSLRSLTAIYYFDAFGVNLSIITTATLLLWFINVLLPILVGSVFIWQLRLTRSG